MNPDELERLVDRELKRLPAPKTPPTLMPRVLMSISRPWYERSWFSWPRSWQAASVVTLAALIIGIGMLQPTVAGELGARFPEFLGSAGARLVAAAREIGTLASAMALVRRAVLEPILGSLAAFIVLMWTACAAFGAALTRLALGGTSQP